MLTGKRVECEFIWRSTAIGLAVPDLAAVQQSLQDVSL
ncbi:Uncharacterized protein ToN1_05240 [Aromatoleum petrolei]|nr:Uncharacterized protein ToN1_05240 [Aromatoleum petrolei]